MVSFQEQMHAKKVEFELLERRENCAVRQVVVVIVNVNARHVARARRS